MRPNLDMRPHRASAPAGAPQRLSVLGSTGSIGAQTLEVARLFPDRFDVRALTAGANADLLIAQAREFSPECAVIGDAAQWKRVAQALEPLGVRALAGREGLCEAAALDGADTVVAALVGFAGLESVIAAVRAGKKVALANKETLVVAGELVARLLRAGEGSLVPVDSEHSAIFQCIAGEPANSVESLALTASGGPFRTRPAETFGAITRAEALAHPNWSMGEKITIDSATMMNKGLEVVEARWLFGVPEDRISILVHPQSIVHSFVAFADGSAKAQLSLPDMRVPIQYALSAPERWPAPYARLDWSSAMQWRFEPPDRVKFPCIDLAYHALAAGGAAPAILNAANEQAVALFLQEKIRFTDIPDAIEHALGAAPAPANPALEDLVACDAEARRIVLERLKHIRAIPV